MSLQIALARGLHVAEGTSEDLECLRRVAVKMELVRMVVLNMLGQKTTHVSLKRAILTGMIKVLVVIPLDMIM